MTTPTLHLPRAALATELQLLQAVAERKSTVPILSSVLVGIGGGAMSLTATDYDCTLVSELLVEGDAWSGCVPREQLLGLCRLLDVEQVALTPQDGKVILKAGRASHKLPLMDLASFPETTYVQAESFVLPLQPLQQAIQAVQFAMLDYSDCLKSTDQPFTGMSIRQSGSTLEVMATRKVVTAIIELPSIVPPFDLVLPKSAVSVLLKLEGEIVEVSIGTNHAQFTAGHRTLIARPLTGSFPQWRNFLPEPTATVTVNRDELVGAIKRASVTMGIDNAVGYEPLKACFQGNTVTISTRGGSRGQSDECVDVQGEADLTVGFIGQQVLSVLKQCGAEVVVELSDSRGAIVLKSEGLTGIVMPVRVAW